MQTVLVIVVQDVIEVDQGRNGQRRVVGKVDIALPASARCLNTPIQLTLNAQGLSSCCPRWLGEQLPLAGKEAVQSQFRVMEARRRLETSL